MKEKNHNYNIENDPEEIIIKLDYIATQVNNIASRLKQMPQEEKEQMYKKLVRVKKAEQNENSYNETNPKKY